MSCQDKYVQSRGRDRLICFVSLELIRKSCFRRAASRICESLSSWSNELVVERANECRVSSSRNGI